MVSFVIRIGWFPLIYTRGVFVYPGRRFTAGEKSIELMIERITNEFILEDVL